MSICMNGKKGFHHILLKGKAEDKWVTVTHEMTNGKRHQCMIMVDYQQVCRGVSYCRYHQRQADLVSYILRAVTGGVS